MLTLPDVPCGHGPMAFHTADIHPLEWYYVVISLKKCNIFSLSWDCKSPLSFSSK